MRKSLVILMALALVFSLSLGVMACNDCEQNVTVKASFLLECSDGGAVSMEFEMDDYGVGYVEAMDKLHLKVGAPASWQVGAVALSNPNNVARALLVSGGAGWVDINEINPKPIKSGGQGVTEFDIHYRVELDDLSTDVNNTVTVQYDFI